MKVLRFNGNSEVSAENYQWLLVGCHAAEMRGTSADTLRGLTVLEKLLSISDVDEAGEKWAYMDEARALKDGEQSVAFTQSEFDYLDRMFQQGFCVGVRPVAQLKYLRRLIQFLADAETVKSDDAAEQGASGAPAGPAKRSGKRA